LILCSYPLFEAPYATLTPDYTRKRRYLCAKFVVMLKVTKIVTG